MWKLKLQSFGHLMRRADSLKRPWSWERLRAGGEGDDRRWDGWMASPTQWTWVWVDSGSWWWTGRPGELQFMGSQRVRHNWATELSWTEEIGVIKLSWFSWDTPFNHTWVYVSELTLGKHLGSRLVARRTNRVIRGWEISAPSLTSGEGRGAGNWFQSPMANKLIDHAYVMKPP